MVGKGVLTCYMINDLLDFIGMKPRRVNRPVITSLFSRRFCLFSLMMSLRNWPFRWLFCDCLPPRFLIIIISSVSFSIDVSEFGRPGEESRPSLDSQGWILGNISLRLGEHTMDAVNLCCLVFVPISSLSFLHTASLKSTSISLFFFVLFYNVFLVQIPNPLFDLAGITCGHFLVPFSVFFGATLLGKAIVKMHIQVSWEVCLLFVILSSLFQ